MFWKKKLPEVEKLDDRIEFTNTEIKMLTAIIADYSVSIQHLQTANAAFVKDTIAVILNKLNKIKHEVKNAE